MSPAYQPEHFWIYYFIFFLQKLNPFSRATPYLALNATPSPHVQNNVREMDRCSDLDWLRKCSQQLKPIFVSAGICILAILTAESAGAVLREIKFQSLFISLFFGMSRGFAVIVLLIIQILRVVAAFALVTPQIYEKCDAALPSAMLIFSEIFQIAIFDKSWIKLVEVLAVSSAACLAALFRADREARFNAAQTPISSPILVIESRVRAFSSKMRMGFFGPLLAVLVIFDAFRFNFWSASKANYAFLKTRFVIDIAIVSNLLILAGIDGKTPLLSEGAVDFLEKATDNFLDLKRHVSMRIRQRNLGRKKAL